MIVDLIRDFKLAVEEDDNEKAHWIEDEIYRKFIQITALELYPPQQLNRIAILIQDEVIKSDYCRWYS